MLTSSLGKPPDKDFGNYLAKFPPHPKKIPPNKKNTLQIILWIENDLPPIWKMSKISSKSVDGGFPYAPRMIQNLNGDSFSTTCMKTQNICPNFYLCFRLLENLHNLSVWFCCLQNEKKGKQTDFTMDQFLFLHICDTGKGNTMAFGGNLREV